MQRCRFEIAPCPPEQVSRLRRELAVSGPLAQVLVRRGLAEPQAARAFLEACEEHPPQAFAGIGEAVARTLAHVRAGTRITVHGDYDVDGVCATAVLVRALRALGADVDFHLPDRVADGYGLSEATVERLHLRGTRLLITVDCAITAVAEVAAAQALGIETIVTDHHAPRADGQLPAAPIVHPRVCGYPCPDLCATAVAYKLAQALVAAASAGAAGERCAARLRALPESESPAADLDLVALATVADLVPLLGENRSLVRRGLRALAATAKPGLRALMAVGGVAPARVDERAVAFALAPRINAAGRLYRADAALELLLTGDRARAAQLAQELDRVNRERRELEQRIRFAAQAQMRELGERSAYVLAGEDWHPGVVGIVASRLVEQSGRPVVMVALEGERARGSGRSIESFDLLGGLQACAPHLLRFGGHRAAAGVELERARLDQFAQALDEHAALALGAGDLLAVERVDAIVRGEELGMELAEELQAMAPFGRANPGVSLMLSQASFLDARPMGQGRHVRFTVHSGATRMRAVAFGTGGTLPFAQEPAGAGDLQATFTLEVNEWNGVSEPRLVLRRVLIEGGAQARTPEPQHVTSAGTNAGALEPAPRERRERPPERPPARPPGRPSEPVAEGEELVLFALP
ncbi:MAG TPA: single-stranded-DNA-specific exonuclease RecJ [Solirubrobacteraceae bacterium]|nr:single-stranded-DNA-specific exonuclease RecJ [Solirubrobacteraceae bacterium]